MDRINEADTKHAPHIPESVSDKIYNSIVRIEKGNLIGTGFFIKIIIKENINNFLVTCEHIIKQEDVNSKITIDIFYGKKYDETKKNIVLDNNQRFIACFGGEKDATVIEILKTDEIPENKYLMPDLSYKYGYNLYKEGNFFLAGYPRDEIFNKERHIASGKIKKIFGNQFEHSLDTRSGSSGAPICLIETIQVIGIHKQGNVKKSINYGTFIGAIIDELEKKYKEVKIKTISKYFFTLEEYNNVEFSTMNKEILNCYNNQNEDNFNKAFNEFKIYLNDNEENLTFIHDKNKFLESLKIFKNVEGDYKRIIRFYTEPSELAYFMSKIFHENNPILKKFYYFIGGFLKALDIAGNILNLGLKNKATLYRVINIPLNELILYKENIGKIISFKGFISTCPYKMTLNFIKNSKPNYKVLFIINYEYKNNLKFDCFDISSLSAYYAEKEIIFPIFNFFQVIKIEINEEKKEAAILLNSIGRK